MCGRYAIAADTDEVKKRFGLRESPAVGNATNIPPGSMLPIIPIGKPKTAVLAKWGLIPGWAKDPKIGNRMINARAETVAEKPSFRKPLQIGRCLVPATGFYEWQTTDSGKVPYYITLSDEPIFAFAGLYDEWPDPEGVLLKTFTIITTEPNSLLSPIHNRMPVILEKTEEADWINPDRTELPELTALLNPYPAEKMAVEAVKL